MTWYPKTRLLLSITIHDETVDPPVLADPTTMTVTYGRRNRGAPAPTVKHYPADVEIVHDATGLFHIEIDCPDHGAWAADVYPSAGVVGDGQLAWTIAKSLVG